MKEVCFEPRNGVPLYLRFCTLGIVLDKQETVRLAENGGAGKLLEGFYPDNFQKYQAFETRIGDQAVMIFRGWREDLQAAYLCFKLKDFFGDDTPVLGDLIPTYGDLLLPRVPRSKNRLYVFVDTKLPALRQYAGRMFTAYRPPEGVDENFVWEAIMKQSRGESSSQKVFMFRAWHGVVGHMARQFSRLGEEACKVEYLELPSFNALLARRIFSATGHKLPRP